MFLEGFSLNVVVCASLSLLFCSNIHMISMVFINEIIKHLFCPIGEMLFDFNFLYTNLSYGFRKLGM